MWTANDILDAVAGSVDSPARWHLQFWIWVAFSPSSVAVIEEGAVYLWVLSDAQVGALGLKDEVGDLHNHPFQLQEVRELSVEQTNYWRNWPFFRVGEEVEEGGEQERDGIWMTMRGFDGINLYNADLTNPRKEFQPLHWQARKDVFLLLEQLFEWDLLISNSI